MKRWWVCVGIVVLLFGCSTLGLPKPKSVCDDLAPGDSLLCDIAHRYDLRLETVGDIIMLANFANVDMQLYSKEEALTVLRSLRIAVNSQNVVTGANVVLLIKDVFKANPMIAAGGALVISPYIGYLDVAAPIKSKDREFMTWWLDQQIMILGGTA